MILSVHQPAEAEVDPEPELDENLFEEFFGLIPTEDLLVIRSYAGDDDDRVLEELRPKYVIMVDPDPAFIRRIEVSCSISCSSLSSNINNFVQTYKAARRGIQMRIYFLMYGSSVEEPKYLLSIRREKEAFEKIIRERGVSLDCVRLLGASPNRHPDDGPHPTR